MNFDRKIGKNEKMGRTAQLIAKGRTPLSVRLNRSGRSANAL